MKNSVVIFFVVIGLVVNSQAKIQEYNADGCLWPFFSKDNGKTITNQTEFENAVRQDASRKRCLKDLEPIDFKKYVLVGNLIRSGHCYRPPGLDYTSEFFEESNTLYLTVFYEEASRNASCRAASRYDLWLLVPKPTENFEVVSRLNPIDAMDFHNDTIVKHEEEFHQQIKTFFSFAEQRKWDKILDATYPKLFDLQPRDKMLEALKQSYDADYLKMYFSDFKYKDDALFFKADTLQCAVANYSSTIHVEFLQNDTQTDAEFEDFLVEMQTKFGRQYPDSDLIKKDDRLHITGPKQVLGIYNTPDATWRFVELTKSSGQLLPLFFEKEIADKILQSAKRN